MQGDQNDWQYLIRQYLEGSISKEAFDALLHKVGKGEDMDGLAHILKQHWDTIETEEEHGRPDWEARFSAMMEELDSEPARRSRHIGGGGRWFRVAAAAVVVALMGGAGYWFLHRPAKAPFTEVSIPHTDLSPGSNGAILTLSNGQQVLLDSTHNALVARQGAARITNRNGQVVYTGTANAAEDIQYNTMTTPKGRQYQLVLADGTRVWLNAGSSIRYPTAFTGKERRVTVTGETYFEVAPHPDAPFLVSAGGVEVTVLGTHFNINAYEDEGVIRTTLLEGSVRVARGSIESTLKPGQQAEVGREGDLKMTNDVDVDAVTAWKNGYFSFSDADLPSVMRQIARWYDVDIVYEGNIPDRRFGGDIPRGAYASQVLQILEAAKVHFRIEGKKIIVMP